MRAVPQKISSLLERTKTFPISFAGIEGHLTPREASCLSLLTHGHTAKQVGKKLDISTRTVESHLARIKARFGLSTKADLLSLVSKNEHLDFRN